MWLNVGAIRRQIDKHAGGGNAARSLYAHFFSRKEEEGIYGRLAGLPEAPQSLEAADFLRDPFMDSITPAADRLGGEDARHLHAG